MTAKTNAKQTTDKPDEVADDGEASYELTFKGLLGLFMESSTDPDFVFDMLVGHMFKRGLGVGEGTCPAIVFEREKDGRLGGGTLTEFELNPQE